MSRIIPTLPVPMHPTHSILDSTKIKAYMECPRQFFYEYVLGWRSIRPNNHLVFGKALHIALEHLLLNNYSPTVALEAYELFLSTYREVFPKETDEIYLPKTPERFLYLLKQYIHEYSDDLQKYEVYKTELGGTIFLSPDHEVVWKMDSILYKKQTGLYSSLEHKSTQSNFIPKSYALDFAMGPQVGTYTHVLNSLLNPTDVDCVEINCLCFKRTKEPSFILERFPIHMSDTQMYVWLENMKSIIDEIYNDYNNLSLASPSDPSLKPFRCNGLSCSNWGRVCQYNDLCTSWPNPLQHLHQRPISMGIDFWNPLEEELREVYTGLK